jgi:hypothetical protein
LGEIKLVFYRKTVDHVEAEVRTPQRAEKRSEDSRKESKSSSFLKIIIIDELSYLKAEITSQSLSRPGMGGIITSKQFSSPCLKTSGQVRSGGIKIP